MDHNERIPQDPFLAITEAIQGYMVNVWTAMPAIVESYDAAKQTASLQPAIQAQQRGATDQTFSDVALPLLLDVPVSWATGGPFAHTFPLAKGDEGLVVFARNCIDAWWQQGGVQPQVEQRMHDLSDAMFVPGIRSQPRKLSGVSTTKMQIRNADQTLMLEMDPATGRVSLVAAGGLWVNGVQVVVP